MKKNKILQFSFWQIQILGWILVKVTIDIQQLSKAFISGNEIPFSHLLNSLCVDLVAFTLTVGMRYLYRYLYKKEYFVLRTIIIIAIVSYIASVITYLMVFPFNEFFGIPIKNLSLPGSLTAIMWNFPIFFVWSLLYFGIKYWKQSIHDRDQVEKANHLAQSAQLQMLRYQLNPHFLFNSLNSIYALIDEDKKATKEMVSELSEFLRYSLVSKNYSDVPLSQELEAVKHFFSIEKKRFESKLDVNIDIDPAAEDYPVLSFILHPLVENAVKFGMKTSSMPLKIYITAKVHDGNLSIIVKNTGKWITPSEQNNGNGTGIGLKNIQLRLDNAFPGRNKFQIKQVDEYVEALIEIQKKQ